MSKEQEKPIEVLFYPACIPKTPVRKTLVPDPDFGMLKTMQNTVDGYIEIIPHPIYPELRIVCNEEGKMLNLNWNRNLFIDGVVKDAIFGDFFICRRNYEGTRLVSLTEEDFEFLMIKDRSLT